MLLDEAVVRVSCSATLFERFHNPYKIYRNDETLSFRLKVASNIDAFVHKRHFSTAFDALVPLVDANPLCSEFAVGVLRPHEAMLPYKVHYRID